MCDGWGTHHPTPLGAYGKPHPSGCGFLAYGRIRVKNKLDFFGQLARIISEYVFDSTD